MDRTWRPIGDLAVELVARLEKSRVAGSPGGDCPPAPVGGGDDTSGAIGGREDGLPGNDGRDCPEPGLTHEGASIHATPPAGQQAVGSLGGRKETEKGRGTKPRQVVAGSVKALGEAPTRQGDATKGKPFTGFNTAYRQPMLTVLPGGRCVDRASHTREASRAARSMHLRLVWDGAHQARSLAGTSRRR